MNIRGRFCKLATTDNSVVVGTLGTLTAEKLTQDIIVRIAHFYNINTNADQFRWHLITAEGAEKRGSKFPVNNYNAFIEFFTA